MDQNLIILQKMKKCAKQLFFAIFCVCKPLDQMPVVFFVICTADQIQAGIIPGKPGCLNIKKRRSSRGPIRSRG